MQCNKVMCMVTFTTTKEYIHMAIDLPPSLPTVEVVASTHGTDKGLRETQDIQVRGDVQVELGDFVIGVRAKNVDGGVVAEGAAYVGASTEVSGFRLSGEVEYKTAIDHAVGYDDDAVEAAVGVGRSFGALATGVTVSYSPDALGLTGESTYLEGSAGFSVLPGTVVGGGVGHGWRENDLDYTAWNVGVEQTVAKGVVLDLRYFDTDRSGWEYAERVTGSIRFNF